MKHIKKYLILFAILLVLAATYQYRGTIETLIPGLMQKAEEVSVGEPATENVDGGVEKEPEVNPNTNPNADTDTGTETASEPPEEAQESAEVLPKMKMIEGVPFISQAPLGDWSDPKQQHGCEEASLIMASHWIRGTSLSFEAAVGEIVAMSDFETEKYGNYYDTSAADTLQLFKDYYDYRNASIKYDITEQDIKREIAAGKLVVLPMNGVKLMNPHYTQPGPELHQLVVIGYDDAKREFITNDPGTRSGKSYRYDYDRFMSAIRDYKTGADEPVDKVVRAMIVIEKDQTAR